MKLRKISDSGKNKMLFYLTRKINNDIIFIVTKRDPLAQSVEHLTFNQGVRSSNLRWVTKKNEIIVDNEKSAIYNE